METNRKKLWIFSVLFVLFTTAGSGLNAAEVQVTLSISGRGPRPYVVVWVETPQGKAVRTLQVWGQKQKYQRHLRNWKRSVENVDGVSGATRPNGDYRTTWDGKDEAGNPMPAGIYVFRAECVREEGAHSNSQASLTIDGTATTAAGSSEKDIKGLTVQFVR